MNFRKTLIALSFVLLATTQQPWTCFPRTSDESYFLQAIKSWDRGNGFWIYDAPKAFEPALTFGVSTAWGTILINIASHLLEGEWFRSPGLQKRNAVNGG
ncbi:MAG TPA: hypothetical protein DCS07_04680 [Bdellovibrionales bacterium]|nr:MAG: hypothetical protein A2Z97_00760 [Bdellovibrionales bacterium GWB1_52_6]OFZ05207.1 MAG: hypothetical protein A2X97_10465 [Bdellovibrionales bacterium GWA1_52_35]HAR41915.1 hypothetical protein [Bdellovibrionales bacterium]HCM38662.1 hypothetical protein [Bdellovibrionales bacterium]